MHSAGSCLKGFQLQAAVFLYRISCKVPHPVPLKVFKCCSWIACTMQTCLQPSMSARVNVNLVPHFSQYRQYDAHDIFVLQIDTCMNAI